MNERDPLPIACSLPSEEQSQATETYKNELFHHDAVEVRKTENGFSAFVSQSAGGASRVAEKAAGRSPIVRLNFAVRRANPGAASSDSGAIHPESIRAKSRPPLTEARSR